MSMSIPLAVLKWLEDHPAAVVDGTRIPVSLETMAADGSTAMMLQARAADRIVRRYKDGGYIARYPFAVWLRVGARDTAARLEAMRVLMEMATSIDDRSSWPIEPEGARWVSLNAEMAPVKLMVHQDGTEDYQVSFELTYAKG